MEDYRDLLWPIAPHTEAKHQILRKYLNAWIPIMTRWQGRVLFIDGFCGPGRYRGGEDGSPIIALKALVEHPIQHVGSEVVFVFIDKQEQYCDILKKTIAEIKLPPNAKIDIICGEFADQIMKLFDYLDEQKHNLAPTLAFIDPFGYSGLPIEIIKKIMMTPKCEVFINFAYDSINRHIGNPMITDVNLQELFGCDDWKDISIIENPAIRKFELHSLYERQLMSVAGIKFIRSFEMINKQNKTSYFLFFGTNHAAGLKMMKHAMWNVAKAADFSFSDRTAGQMTLFSSEPDFAQLKSLIISEFRGREVTINQITNFVIEKTCFLDTHIKKQILREMEYNDPPELIVLSQGRRRGTYPDGTLIRFF